MLPVRGMDARGMMWRDGEISEVERQPLMLLYFISSYFSSSSLVSLGHRDIHAFSLDTFLASGWCNRVPIVYKLQIFSCVVDIPLPKNVFSYFACHSQYRGNLGLIMNIQYFIPGWVLGWLRSVLFFLWFLTEMQDPLQKARTIFQG